MELRALVGGATEHVAGLQDADLSLALECALRAGAVIRAGWEGGLEALEVKEKGVGDLVSAVDVRAEEAVLSLLRGSHARDDLILSEETLASTRPEAGKRMWIIDPLDGTASFVFHTSPELVSVLVALYDCDLRRVTHAVEFFPIGSNPRAVYARLGKGAFVNGARLRVPDAVCVPLSRAWVNLNHYSDFTFENSAFARLRQRLRTPGGGACRMVTTLPATSGVACMILLGDARLSAVVHDNDSRNVKQGPWDTAAPQLIVEEAGGVFLSARSGSRYDTLSPEMVLIAATPELAQEILDIIQSE